MDKIVAGSNVANTPEHQAMAKLIGKDTFNLSDIEAFAGKFGKRQYGKFLENYISGIDCWWLQTQ